MQPDRSGPPDRRQACRTRERNSTRFPFVTDLVPAAQPGKWRGDDFFRMRLRNCHCLTAIRASAVAGSNITRTAAAGENAGISGDRAWAVARPGSTRRNNAPAAIVAERNRQASPSTRQQEKGRRRCLRPLYRLRSSLVTGVGNHCLVLSQLLLINSAIFYQVDDLGLNFTGALRQFLQVDQQHHPVFRRGL